MFIPLQFTARGTSNFLLFEKLGPHYTPYQVYLCTYWHFKDLSLRLCTHVFSQIETVVNVPIINVVSLSRFLQDLLRPNVLLDGSFPLPNTSFRIAHFYGYHDSLLTRNLGTRNWAGMRSFSSACTSQRASKLQVRVSNAHPRIMNLHTLRSFLPALVHCPLVISTVRVHSLT